MFQPRKSHEKSWIYLYRGAVRKRRNQAVRKRRNCVETYITIGWLILSYESSIWVQPLMLQPRKSHEKSWILPHRGAVRKRRNQAVRKRRNCVETYITIGWLILSYESSIWVQPLMLQPRKSHEKSWICPHRGAVRKRRN